MNNPGRPPGCGGQIAVGSAKRSAATSARASGAAGLSPAGSGSAHIAAAERTALPGPPGGKTERGRAPGGRPRGRGAPRGRCPPPGPPRGWERARAVPERGRAAGPAGRCQKGHGKGSPGACASGAGGDTAWGCRAWESGETRGGGTSGGATRLVCDPHAACPGVKHPWGKRGHPSRVGRCGVRVWHAERVRDTACPCDSVCVRGSARVGEKPCSRSTSPPSAPRDRGAEPTRVRAPPWEGAPGAQAGGGPRRRDPTPFPSRAAPGPALPVPTLFVMCGRNWDFPSACPRRP